MPLITASNLTKFYDTNLILDHIAFAIDNRERLGFIGANGTGKTTLCRILMREESCEDDSIIHFARGMTVGYLSQDMDFGSAKTPWDAVLTCFPQMQRIETRLSQLEHQMGETHDVHQRESLLDAHAKLQTEYEALGGFTYHHRAAATLTGLGVPEAAFGRELSSFSGGEQRRVALARLLLTQPDLLLLDEPTNHLDIRGIEWLEYYLRNYSGAVIAISHDRWFLDAVAQRIIELENQTLNEYRGGYSAYVQQKEQRVLTYERQFERQQDEMKRQMSFIRWALGTGQAKKVTAAKSRLKLLDKIDYLDPPASQKRKMSIRFEPRVRGGDEVLELKKVSKSFGDRRLFSGIDMFVKRGQRVGIVGPNGSGKTTLLNIMLGLEEANAGEVRLGRSVEVGYHRQEEYGLDPNRTVYHEFKSVIPDAEETEVRSLLARFLFVEDDVFKPVSVLSGGEQSRLSLAKLMMTRPTLLVLDEPTNHLDIDSRSALEAALLEYKGTLIVVSHDRYFLNNVVNRVLVLENGTARMHEGNYSSYTAKLKAAAEEVEQAEAVEREAQKQLRYREERLAREEKKKHGDRASSKKSAVTSEELEERAAYLEGQLQKLRELLGLPETYDNIPRASALEGEYHKLSTELEQVYEQWEAAELAREAKQAARLL